MRTTFETELLGTWVVLMVLAALAAAGARDWEGGRGAWGERWDRAEV
jgi:hypothetical protein